MKTLAQTEVNTIRINYNVTGTQRKELVTVVGSALEAKPKYLGMPSAAYQIDYFIVTNDGTLDFDDMADSVEVKKVLEAVAAAGFNPALQQEYEETGLTVKLTLDKVTVGILTNILKAKGTLIKKALGIDGLRFEIQDGRIVFPWFPEVPEADEARAYTEFLALLCKHSKELKRATATEKPVTNEKYAFRCFLLRLGFIGSEYKQERKILLRNLSGNSSWKNGIPEKEVRA